MVSIILVSHDIIVRPCNDHHVEVRVYQNRQKGTQEPRIGDEVTRIHDTRNHRRHHNPLFADCDLGFFSHNVRPAVVANEVMLIVFFQIDHQDDVASYMKLASFHIITLGKSSLHTYPNLVQEI